MATRATSPVRDAAIETPGGEDKRNFTIGDLAAEFGVTPRALRFYEDKGLIAPRRVGQSRLYSRRDRARLAWILRGKNVGFSLAEIREMIDMYDESQAKQRRFAIEKCSSRIEDLKQQKRDIDSAIEELEYFVAAAKAEDDRRGRTDARA